MVRLFFLSVMILLLSGCVATTAQEIQSTVPPTVQAHATEPAVPPTTGATPMATSVAPTATSSADTVASAERAAFADAWQHANQGEAEATALLYFGSNGENALPLALWQLSLSESSAPQQAMMVGSERLTPVPGDVSPDGNWIAYLEGRDVPFTLRVSRIDGSDSRIVSPQIGLHDSTSCVHKFAWSPTGNTLAFIQHWEEGDEFGKAVFVFDPRTDATAREVSRFPGGMLVGWDNANRFLVLVATAYQQPLDLVAFDVDTGNREVLLQMPTNETAFCTRMAPNHERVLMQLGTQDYLYDVNANQLTAVDISSLTSVWSSDGTSVLEFSGDAARATRLVSLDGSLPVTTVNLASPDAPDRLFGILSASPDGRYIVICESANERTHRSLLYTVNTQQWQTIDEGFACLTVAGWLVTP